MAQLTTSDNYPLQFLERGQGPLVLFLHGWSSSALEWLPFAEALGSHHRVICCHARGHGLQRHHQDLDVSLDRMSRDLFELLEDQATDGAIVVGHSMGALTLWNYIAHYGCKHLNGLCIIDQSPKLLTDMDWPLGVYGQFCERTNKRFIEHLERNFPDAVCRLILGQLERLDQPLPATAFVKRLTPYLGSLPSNLLIRCWQSLTEADLRSVLATIDVPTLLIYGEQSQFYSTVLAQWVHQQIANSTLLRYPQADHSPHLADRNRFINDIATFAARLFTSTTHSGARPC